MHKFFEMFANAVELAATSPCFDIETMEFFVTVLQLQGFHNDNLKALMKLAVMANLCAVVDGGFMALTNLKCRAALYMLSCSFSKNTKGQPTPNERL